MSRRVIDLTPYTIGVPILVGRERGEAVRKALNIDEVDRSHEEVDVLIPDWVYSVTSSFFLGLFEKSIKELGEDEFRRMFHFTGLVGEQAREQGIARALLMGKRFQPLRRAVG
jgi:hypothetical protein